MNRLSVLKTRNFVSRRRFFRQSAGIGVALAASSVYAKGLNEQLNLGFIGLGGRGNELLQIFGKLPDARIAALCDPDRQHLQEASEKYPDAATYADLRHLLDDANVDAVVIATCNHWHALAAIWACRAGKDVYVEKPLAHNHWEGQQVVRAARKYERIVQVGTQQRSDPLQQDLKEFLHEQKALGPIHYVEVCRFGPRAPIGQRKTPLQLPDSIDYDLWIGPARDEPIYRDKLHYDWHWDWNTGNGEMGNWGVHVLDDALNVVLRDRVAFPKRIATAGGRVKWNDAGQTPNVCYAYYDTGNVPIFFALSNLATRGGRTELSFKGVGSGYVIHCEGGYYAGGRGGGAARDHKGTLIKRFRGNSGEGHARNFLDAVYARDRALLNAEVAIGQQSTAWCNLADVAVRVGHPYSHAEAADIGAPVEPWRQVIGAIEGHLEKNSVDFSRLYLSPVLEFDATREQFVGDQSDNANRLLRREYRPQFEVPAIT